MNPAIAVIGSATADERLSAAAERVGERLARAGVTVVCGGLGGVMEAVCRGARRGGGLTVGILPGARRADANEFVDVVLATGMGEARNTLVARAGLAVIAIGGGFGTLSELAFARKLGVPVIGLHTWRFDGDGLVHVDTAEEAARLAVDIALPSTEAPRRG